MTQVSLSALSKIYPGATAAALSDLTLDIPSGSLTALLGPSGCGKTTALKMIAGLLHPSSGDVLLDGRSILLARPEHRGTVMVFQNPLLFPHMSVAENVAFGLRMRHLPRALIAERVAEMLAMVKLPDFGARKPADLSGGQQQRVALARALIVAPKVLLLDEPLSNLDAHLRDEMRDLVRALQTDLKITTIFVTHDQQEAVILADQIALILDGKLRQYGPPDHFYNRPETKAVARFFGAQNFIPGHSDGTRFHSALGPLTVPPGGLVGPGTLTIRPEAIRIGQGPQNVLIVEVTDRVYLGAQTRLNLRCAGIDLVATSSPAEAQALMPGQTLPITLPPENLWVLAKAGSHDR